MQTDFHSIDDLHENLRIRHGLLFYLRLFVGVFLGLLAALALGWFMHYLIQSSDMVLIKSERNHMLDFVRVKRSESVQRKDRAPERPQLNKTPEVPQISQGDSSGGQQLAVAPMAVDTNVDISQDVASSSTEGEYMPIVKVAPVYPSTALSRGLEGTCLVEYTVSTAGKVKNVKVIEDQCIHKVFYRPSIEAALRFKYRPRIIDGVATEVPSVFNLFRYEIEK
ncbi:MAG: energy transducer TonB [Gammaproteobacteria bacterium]|nr:energy transducer TonB [Gammaproteobacteria bacterium]MBT8150657.1 energy transducer TonB [Gammaproteobacteria bacterium]NND39631.1 energy transducer TonB [Pseudomonadales bacterium]NNM11871.1 energy transducer TonB [Pseudomonadales bacterium]RZV57767.1 MAG: energy transducer TonB [Pseudomonadales bacterium]